MDVLIHLGAHCTDDGLLIRSVLRNRAVLAEDGVAVPGPGRYREMLGQVSTTLRGEPASAQTEQMLLETLNEDERADRLVLSNENFLCRAKVAVGEDGLYPKAEKSAWLRNCFPSHQVHFAICIRDPAVFVPCLLRQLSENEREALMPSLSPQRLSWIDVIEDIVEANPESSILVWRHEDAPLIWANILTEVTAHGPDVEMKGSLDLVENTLTEDGAARFRAFLDSHPNLSPERRAKTVTSFLATHSKPDDQSPEIADLGWTPDTIATLSETYRDDFERIRSLPGVAVLVP